MVGHPKETFNSCPSFIHFVYLNFKSFPIPLIQFKVFRTLPLTIHGDSNPISSPFLTIPPSTVSG